MADSIQNIEEWVQEGNSFPVQFQLLSFDTSCSVGIDSFSELECGADGGTSDNDNPTTSTGVIIGAVVAIVLILLIITVTVAIVVVVRRKRQVSLDLNDLK